MGVRTSVNASIPGASPARRERLATLALLLALIACAASRGETGAHRPRNLLVLLADDLSGCDLGCYGNRDVNTPNLDRLASDGARFERAYAAVGMCQPSRSSLFTGLYPNRHGALGFGPIRDDVATWPELLRARGVTTALIGKLDVDPPEKFDFDHLARANEMPSRRDPAVWARQFREFLGQTGDRPFAAVIAFVDPHRPFEEEAGEPLTDPGRIAVPARLWESTGTRTELARYYDCVARLDRSVGKILDALEESGRAADTLVIFTSDNGASFPFAKSTLYEAGVRMPLIVRGPGVRRGVSDEFVGLVDLLPTALELFGAPPRDLDGESLLPTLRGDGALGRTSFVTMQTENNREQSQPARALHERRFKYIRNFGTGGATVSNVVGHTLTWESGKELAPANAGIAQRMKAYIYRPREELYDLERDPQELVDLADDAGQAAIRDRMRADLRAWMEQHGDPLLAEWDR